MSHLRIAVLSALIVGVIPAFAGSAPGIQNFDKVDDHVYRGAQPTGPGIAYLAKIGVKTVIDLRGAGKRSLDEGRAVKAAGMTYVTIAMGALAAPRAEDIAKALALLEDPATGPVFVHCKRGADRTGVVIAAYHIHHDRWDNQRALQDANAHHMSSLQRARRHFIRDYRSRAVEPDTAQTAPAGKS